MKAPSIFIALILLFSAFSFAQSSAVQPKQASDSVHFRDVTFSEGLKMAQAENKPLFFLGYATWCEHCKHMKEVIFKDSIVAAYFNKNFVCMKQDMEKGEGTTLHKRFQVKSYPLFVFLDSTGTTLYQSIGERNDTTMITEGKNALTPTLQFPYLKQQFEADVTNADKCLTYILALRNGRLDCSEPAKKYLATQNEKQLLSEINWRIIANGIMEINSREFQFVLSHQKEYAVIASPTRVERKIINVADELLSHPVNWSDSAAYFSRRPQAVSIHNPKVDSVIFKYDLAMYEKLKNWDEYKKVASKSVETIAWNDGSLLKEIANNYLAHVTDTVALGQAANWVKHAIELKEEYPSYILSAKLFSKAGDKNGAIEMAQKGKDSNAKFGWAHNEADSLLGVLHK